MKSKVGKALKMAMMKMKEGESKMEKMPKGKSTKVKQTKAMKKY